MDALHASCQEYKSIHVLANRIKLMYHILLWFNKVGECSCYLTDTYVQYPWISFCHPLSYPIYYIMVLPLAINQVLAKCYISEQGSHPGLIHYHHSFYALCPLYSWSFRAHHMIIAPASIFSVITFRTHFLTCELVQPKFYHISRLHMWVQIRKIKLTKFQNWLIVKI